MKGAYSPVSEEVERFEHLADHGIMCLSLQDIQHLVWKLFKNLAEVQLEIQTLRRELTKLSKTPVNST